NYAEPKKVESDTAPEIKDGENPIWVDTSRTPHVSHVVNNGKWVKMTPTTPAEVDAYTKQQVNELDGAYHKLGTEYTDEKSEQALKDAKAFSENANNINKGVIDVGAIPLRTSITGARLEWDGVNGLVQYDMQGDPVSWLDLDANAHFANAFLSGRVEALEGYFGKNQQVTIGDNGLTMRRPDGAVWMENGQVFQDFTITGYDPYLMGEIYTPGGRYPAFSTEPGSGGYYFGDADVIDGTEDYSEDIRDKRSTVNFQRYQFIHSARYFIARFQVSNRTANMSAVRVCLYDGDKQEYEEKIERSSFGGWTSLIVDLGKPTYERRSIDLHVGHIKGWKERRNKHIYIFRLSRVYLSDFLD